jgi:hypothetical protein
MHNAATYITNLASFVKFILLAYGILQIAQMFDLLDPLRGKYYILPQVGAVIATLGALGWAGGTFSDRQSYPKRKLVRRTLWFLVGTMLLFFCHLTFIMDCQSVGS